MLKRPYYKPFSTPNQKQDQILEPHKHSEKSQNDLSSVLKIHFLIRCYKPKDIQTLNSIGAQKKYSDFQKPE